MTLPFEEYENGINEYLPVFGDANGRYYDLKEVIEYIPKTQVDPRLGYNFKHYFPTRNLKLKVDKEACIRNGIVPEEMQDQMVDEIRWTVRSSYVYKNALFLLDFMASNNWERPVYFTSFNDVASVLGIDKYLYMEGLSYRFIPVEVDSKDYRRNYGGVYRKGSYDLLVNKAQWGNMNTKGVVPDRESMRNVDFARQSYIRLAKSHILYEENDSAVVVMDTYQKFFPNEKFPFGTSLYQFPEMYYSCNELQKGDEFMRKLMKNCCDKVDYFGNMQPKFADEYKDIITEQILVMDELQQAAKKYKRTELLNELNDILPGYRKQFKRYLGSDYFRYLEFMESL